MRYNDYQGERKGLYREVLMPKTVMPACHSERSEESVVGCARILHFAQNDIFQQ